MNLINLIQVVILGLVEGITEWLPISSTGHMILINEFMGIKKGDFFDSQIFLYVIQLGAILAIATIYFNKLNPFAPSKTLQEKKDTWQMWFKVIVACVPAAVLGLLFQSKQSGYGNCSERKPGGNGPHQTGFASGLQGGPGGLSGSGQSRCAAGCGGCGKKCNRDLVRLYHRFENEVNGGVFMKVWKKNLVAAAVLVTVCAGIYVNWLYTEEQAAANLSDTLDAEKVMSDETLILSEDMAAIADGREVDTTATDYFAAVRLSRQQARDNAVNLLQDAMAYATGGEGTKDVESAMELEEIVQTALSEAQIESLIVAKGYSDCVAYMSSEGISVAVPAPEGGLQDGDVAVIADIVMTQSDYSIDDIRVVEVQ